MFCSQCGTRLSATARYCEECGTPIARNAPAAPSGSLRAPAGSLHIAPLINVTVAGAAPAQPVPTRRGVLALPSPRLVGWCAAVGLWTAATFAFTGSIRLNAMLLGMLLVVTLVNRLLWPLLLRSSSINHQGSLWWTLSRGSVLMGVSYLCVVFCARYFG